MIVRPHFPGEQRSPTRPSRQLSLFKIYGVLLLSFAILAAWLVRDLQQGYEKILADTSQLTMQRSQIISHSFRSQVLSADYVLRDVLGRIQKKDLVYPDVDRNHVLRMTNLLKEKADTVPDFFSMVIFDQDCVFTATATGMNIGVKSKAELCAARKMHRTPGPLASFVPGSKFASGQSVIVLSRHLISPKGDFQGGVLGVIELKRAQHWFDSLSSGSGESVALLDDSLTLLARHPALPEAIEKRASPLNIPATLPSASGSVQQDVDGRERVFGFSQIEGFPFIVAYGFDKTKILKGWQRRSVELAAGYFTLLFMALWVARSHWTTLRQREELRASKEHFRTLFESTSDAVMVLDQHGILECNEASLRVFGCASKEDFLKLPAADLSPSKQPCGTDSVSLMGQNIEQALRQSAHRFDWVHKRLDNGQLFPAEVLLNPIHINAQGAVEAVVRDITERKSLQLELERRVLTRTEELATARAEAESANAVKTRFMANVSHEMRTPMNGIMGFAEIGKIKAAKDSAGMYADYFDKILGSAKRLHQLIDSLLRLTEAALDEQSGVEKKEWQKIELEKLVAQCISLMEKTAASRQQNIYLESPATSPCVLGDEPRLRQVFNHLLNNALRYSPDQSTVIVRIQDEPMGSERPATVKIQVIDQGCGIPEKELGAIFEPFYESTRTATGAGGTGLGLALSTKIIERHKGRITAGNRPEGGATFEVIMPST